VSKWSIELEHAVYETVEIEAEDENEAWSKGGTLAREKTLESADGEWYDMTDAVELDGDE
jgi:hypothetical protein